MATGGIFTIITNDGKQDRMLMATALLADRLTSIHSAKLAANRATYGSSIASDDVRNLPSLLDIEKTHILFTNAHFKPFAAIGFEYNKVRPSSGSVAFGSIIQFSIPQFGDFFHDVAAHIVLQQPTITVTAGTSLSDQPAMRWCSWPGERLLKKVQQEVNGNPLDEYTLHATVAHREYRVHPNKYLAWQRCVGQERAVQGYASQANYALSNVGPQSFRVGASLFMGNQTPTAQKDTTTAGQLEMFIPLLFWYNKDVRLAVPSVAIPYGQRFINIELAQQNEMVDVYPRGAGTWASPNGTCGTPTISTFELYINNIFMNPEVHKIYIKRVGFSLIRVHRQQLFTLNNPSQDLLLQQLKWPVEYLFVGAKNRDYFSPSDPSLMRKNLDSWDKYSIYTDNTFTQAGYVLDKASALCAYDPTGTLTLGVTTSGALTGNSLLAQNLPVGSRIRIAGTSFTVTTAGVAGALVTATVVVTPFPAVAISATNAVPPTAQVLTSQGQDYSAKTWVSSLDSVTVTAHGINIYQQFPSSFFNAYTTYHYGGPNINAPTDVGSLFIPFCLFPGSYQPSGHINISRAREFYLTYTASVFDPNGAAAIGILVIIASAINFLLISDGSAVLRYST